jgi:hypothetical protein
VRLDEGERRFDGIERAHRRLSHYPCVRGSLTATP